MSIDWINALTPTRTLKNVRIDITGDWFRDPWGWPEYDYLLDNHLDWLAKWAEFRGLHRVVQINVPKENFGIRPAVVMDPIDRLLYQGLVDAISKKLIGDLADWVYGWRLRRNSPKAGEYSTNRREWDLQRRYVNAAALFCNYGLRTDIVSCFASIPIDRLSEEVERRAGRSQFTSRLLDMLAAFDTIPGRGGLAQRCMASSTLANMYLSRLSYVLEEYSKSHFGSPILQKVLDGTFVLRWMDDIWAFGNDEVKLRLLQVDLQAAARDAGLELNLGKTALVSEEDLWLAAQEVEHSAVDAALRMKPRDVEPLERLLDHIIEDPARADRTSIRFAMTRMRRQKVDSRLDRLIGITPLMPHGADHLARAFRDFGIWQSHQDWFIEYSTGPWRKISWSVAQIGTMFPTKTVPTRSVIDHFAKFVTKRSDFPLLALGAQRLAAWDSRQARDVLHDLVRVADHPQERRIIALAGVAAGEETRFIRRVLSEYEENQLLLAMLEDRGFRAVDPVPDFSAG